MVLNSSRLMPRLSRSYCGMVLYFANSACQSASPSGGTAPVTGFHSTIESPDSVSRVAPPTSTMANTSEATHHSHTPTARDTSAGLRVPASAPHNASSVPDGCYRTVMGPLTLVYAQQHDPSRPALCRPLHPVIPLRRARQAGQHEQLARRVPLVVFHDIGPLKIVFHNPQLFFEESTFRQSDFRRPKLVFMPLLAPK